MLTKDKLVTVYTLKDPTEAEMIRNLLVDHGIACSLDGEHQAGFSGVFSIGVMVFADDVEKAKDVLQAHHVEDPE